MARRVDKAKAIKLRKAGMSYSQIKEQLGISKSTLSGWLRDMPLSQKRLLELQKNERVIEKIRLSKQKKRDARLQLVFTNISNEIGSLSKREIFIAGLFLYWAEGGKTTKYSISLSNTDPAMIRFFIQWLVNLGVQKDIMAVRLHLYADMNINNETKYWRKETGLPAQCFRNPYIKNSKLSELTYISRGHGTCNVVVNGRDLAEKIHQALLYIASIAV